MVLNKDLPYNYVSLHRLEELASFIGDTLYRYYALQEEEDNLIDHEKQQPNSDFWYSSALGEKLKSINDECCELVENSIWESLVDVKGCLEQEQFNDKNFRLSMGQSHTTETIASIEFIEMTCKTSEDLYKVKNMMITSDILETACTFVFQIQWHKRMRRREFEKRRQNKRLRDEQDNEKKDFKKSKSF